MTRHALALAAGLVLGTAWGQWRSADELAALDADLARMEARQAACERVVEARVTEAQEQVAGQCALAAAACSTCAESTVQLEQRVRSFLWVGPGPRVTR